MRRFLGLVCLLWASSLAAQVPVDTVDVTPALDTLLPRHQVMLTARIVDSLGRAMRKFGTWTVRDTSAMRSSTVREKLGESKVLLRAKSDTGRSYVVYTAGTKKDSGLVIVRDTTCSEAAVNTINLFPDSSTAHRTDSLGVTATPRNTCGHLMGGLNLTWASSDSTKVTITRLDSLTARAVVLDSSGTIYVKAISGTKRDSTKLKLKHAP